MNSSELTAELSKKLGFEKGKISEYLESFGTIVTDQLKQNNSVPLQGIGTLETRKKDERVIVHPATGKRMLIPPKLAISLKVSGNIKEKIKQIQK